MVTPLASPRFQNSIEKVAAAQGLNLANPSAFLLLINPPFERLIIERRGVHRLAVTHLYTDGDVDLSVEFFTSAAGWYAISSQNCFGARTVAWLDAGGQRLTRFIPDAQHDIARFCNSEWARNLLEQGYTRATIEVIREGEPARQAETREPTTPKLQLAAMHTISFSIAAIATLLDWRLDPVTLVNTHLRGATPPALNGYVFVSSGSLEQGEISSAISTVSLPVQVISLQTNTAAGRTSVNLTVFDAAERETLNPPCYLPADWRMETNTVTISRGALLSFLAQREESGVTLLSCLGQHLSGHGIETNVGTHQVFLSNLELPSGRGLRLITTPAVRSTVIMQRGESGRDA